MLWSDPPDEPPEELREVQAKLRRLGIVLAVAAVLVMLLLAGCSHARRPAAAAIVPAQGEGTVTAPSRNHRP
ncbi:hypothetical protein IPZ61_18175 [Streptomyces sioyaensis]|nr:hypothetical protein [Streptomyces sioyaensis]MCF3175237.1 hypothetical protein [Streptomyces sioyaensis]